MEISTASNSIKIVGNIKSVHDYQEIKNSLERLASNSKDIEIQIVDSISITSSVIGYFNKLILKDGIHISMKIGNSELLELLDDLNLLQVFQAGRL